MGQVVYIICCIVILLAGAWSSCPHHCICRNVVIDSQSGVDVDCSELYLADFPSISGSVLKLDFSRNRLRETPTSINLLTELRKLDLSNNRLSEIADNLFSTLVHLTVLNLSKNYLSILTLNTFNGLPRLEKLDLHGNEFSQLPLGMLQSLPTTVIVVCLGDNPWDCDRCEFRETLSGYLSYEQNDLANFCNSEIPTCALPPSLNGRAFTKVSFEEIPECSEEKHLTTSWTFISTASVSPTEASAVIGDSLNLIADSSTERSTLAGDSLNSTVGTKLHTTIIPIHEYEIPKESSVKTTSDVDMVVPPNRSASGDVETKDDSQVLMAVAIVILGVMLLIIFLVFSIMLWKMQRKQKKDTISCNTPTMDPFLMFSPWPLLQGRQASATGEPEGVASSQLTVYEEIPCSQGENFDGYETSKDMSKTESEQTNGEPGGAKTGFELYSVKIDNSHNTILQKQSIPTKAKISQAAGNEIIALKYNSSTSDATEETDLSRSNSYMEMRSPVGIVDVKDLYAPR